MLSYFVVTKINTQTNHANMNLVNQYPDDMYMYLLVCSPPPPTPGTALTGVMVMSPQPGPDYPAQALPAKDMPPDYNWQAAPQGYEAVPAPAAAPYQPPAYSVLGPPGSYHTPGSHGVYSKPPTAPQAGGIWQPDNTDSKPGMEA